jgi:hypothetical protein
METKKKAERKVKPTKEAKKVTFPCDSFINAYGFLGLHEKAVPFEYKKGAKMNVTIDFRDGALIVMPKAK